MAQKPFPLAVLVALAAGENHAYAIEQQMISDAQGQLVVYHRAVYRELPRLANAGLIEPVAETRPLRYRLTSHGRRILSAERTHAEHTYRLLQTRL